VTAAKPSTGYARRRQRSTLQPSKTSSKTNNRKPKQDSLRSCKTAAQTMEVNIPVKIYETDYVLFDVVDAKPIEDFDTIYAMEQVVELFNDGFRLEPNEKFVKMTDLPNDILIAYAKAIIWNQSY
jgi:hypothetical protein